MNAQEQAYPFRNTLFEQLALAGALGSAAAERGRVSQEQAPFLAPGQLWQLQGAYVEVVGIDKGLVLYRVLKQKGQKALTRVLKRQALENYLKENAGTLVS